MLAADHPLTGRALRARHVYRRYGQLWLVLELPDGGVGSVEVGVTDVLEAEPVVTAPSGAIVLSGEGARRLLGLLQARKARLAPSTAGDPRAGGEHDGA